MWRIDLASGLTTRLTDDWGWEWDPSWSPDGLQIAFNHAPEQGGLHSLYVRPADASGTNTLLADTSDIHTPDWSRVNTYAAPLAWAELSA